MTTPITIPVTAPGAARTQQQLAGVGRAAGGVARSVRGTFLPFLGGSILGAAFGGSLLSIITNSGAASNSMIRLQSTLEGMLDTLGLFQGLEVFAEWFAGLEDWQRWTLLGTTAGALVAYSFRNTFIAKLALQGIAAAIAAVVGPAVAAAAAKGLAGGLGGGAAGGAAAGAAGGAAAGAAGRGGTLAALVRALGRAAGVLVRLLPLLGAALGGPAGWAIAGVGVAGTLAYANRKELGQLFSSVGNSPALSGVRSLPGQVASGVQSTVVNIYGATAPQVIQGAEGVYDALIPQDFKWPWQ